MNAPRNDHYVPQFVLKNFRPSLAAKLFYAEKGSPHIGRRSPRRVFREPDGELLLRGPPALKEEGGVAVLAGTPDFAAEIRAHLTRLEGLWAPAIKYLVDTVYEQHATPLRLGAVTPVHFVPPEHAASAALGKDYCVRQMWRSPDAGNELWARHLETEEQELRAWIESVLGRTLEPSQEVRTLWREHNRHKIRTGAEADAEGLWYDSDSTFVLTTWFAHGEARFVLGSRGGVWVPHDESSLWICPVNPHVALGIEGRAGNARALGMPPDPRRHFAKGYVLPRDGLTVRDINRASWEQCDAVIAARRHDIAELL